MESGLTQRLRSTAPQAFAALPVKFAYLFGSQVGGRPRPDSDVDVAILADDDVAEADYDQLTWRCTDALAAASGVPRIEVTVLNRAPLRFVGRVLRQRVVLFSRDEPARVAYESLMGRMADDVEIWAAPLDRELLTAIAEGRR
jgi:predicted nucleotidyltransferase